MRGMNPGIGGQSLCRMQGSARDSSRSGLLNIPFGHFDANYA